MLIGVFLIMNMNEQSVTGFENTVASEELRIVFEKAVKSLGLKMKVSKTNMRSALDSLSIGSQEQGQKMVDTLVKLSMHIKLEESVSWNLYSSQFKHAVNRDLKRIQKFFSENSIKSVESDYLRFKSNLEDSSLTQAEILCNMQRIEILMNSLYLNYSSGSVNIINPVDKEIESHLGSKKSDKIYKDFDTDHNINEINLLIQELESCYRKGSYNADVAKLVVRPNLSSSQLMDLFGSELEIFKSKIHKDMTIRKDVFECSPISNEFDSELVGKAEDVASIIYLLSIKMIEQGHNSQKINEHKLKCLAHLQGFYINWAVDTYSDIVSEASKNKDPQNIPYLIEKIHKYSALLPNYNNTDELINQLQEISDLADCYKKDAIGSKLTDFKLVS